MHLICQNVCYQWKGKMGNHPTMMAEILLNAVYTYLSNGIASTLQHIRYSLNVLFSQSCDIAFN